MLEAYRLVCLFFPLLVYLAGMKSVLHETASVSVIHTISAGYLSTVNLVLKQHMERWKWKESCGVALNFCFSLMQFAPKNFLRDNVGMKRYISMHASTL